MEKKCTDCDLDLNPINVIEKGNAKNFIGFDYTVGEPPKKSFFNTSDISNSAGSIQGFVCPKCLRVSFYAFHGKKVETY